MKIALRGGELVPPCADEVGDVLVESGDVQGQVFDHLLPEPNLVNDRFLRLQLAGHYLFIAELKFRVGIDVIVGGNLEEVTVREVEHSFIGDGIGHSQAGAPLAMSAYRHRFILFGEVVPGQFVSIGVEVVEADSKVDDHIPQLDLVLDVNGQLQRFVPVFVEGKTAVLADVASIGGVPEVVK